MTVGELREALKQFPQGAVPVVGRQVFGHLYLREINVIRPLAENKAGAKTVLLAHVGIPGDGA
jgi:hypothetical protein